MKNYPFTLAGARLAYLMTITRVDLTAIRMTGYSKSITIGSETWTPEPGLEIGDITETNRGDVPNLSFKVSTGNLFDQDEIDAGLFEAAECRLYICNAANPLVAELEFVGLMKGDVTFNLDGRAEFEVLNKFALARDVFVRRYSIEDDVDFGDPRRSKVPTFPTVDATSDDLADV